jgi:beta-galactosidase GanA
VAKTNDSGLRSHVKSLPIDPHCPFPVGVEYYRAPVPPTQFWDNDFKRISDAGLTIVRAFHPWNWAEPAPGQFEFDDLDLFFDLAHKHRLKVWLDIPVGTHMACPEWMIRENPDMAVQWRDGSIQFQTAISAASQGSMIHNFDHPKWRVYAGRYIQAVVERFKDHPSMHVWGAWDGVWFAAAWSGGDGYPPYNDYTIAKYIAWLKERFTLDELNARLLRRYRSWDDVQPPRSNEAIVEMMLYCQFHYENAAEHLGWMADLIDTLDGKHEIRSHGICLPRQIDEIASPKVDSWGLSMGSSDNLTSDDPYIVADRAFGFNWCRSVGRDGRWWNEEIYSGTYGRISFPGRQSSPEEMTLFLWLTLIEGGAGALYWQYRPEYMTFEGPGLNLMSLDGGPTPRWKAVERAVAEIRSIGNLLPLEIPKAQVATVYSAASHEVFHYAEQPLDLTGVYRTHWANSIPHDVISINMDWSGYKAIYLPNTCALDDTAISRIRQTLESENGPAIIADGHFGTVSGKGHWSFNPPEGLADLAGARLVDFDRITEREIRLGRNVLETEYGRFAITEECDYAILEPKDDAQVAATLGDRVVGVQRSDRRLTWFGISLSAGFGGTAPADLALPLFESFGITSPFQMEGDRLVAYLRRSPKGGSIVFLLNLEDRTARATVKALWQISHATDLLSNRELPVVECSFDVAVAYGQVAVIHCR